MPQQKQPAEAKQDKSRKRAEPAPAAQPSAELAAVSEQAVGPLAAAGDGTIDGQAARLRDRRLLTAQRQAIARDIGQVQGNRHLQGIIAPVGLRTTGAGPTVALQGDPKAARPEVKKLAELRPRVEQAKSNADARGQAVQSFVDDAQETLTRVERRIGQIADLYQGAYDSFSQALSAARQAAQSKEDMQNAILGIVLGAAIGFGVGEAFAAATIAGKMASEVGGELGEWAAGSAARREGSSGALEPQPKWSELTQLGAWQNLTRAYKELIGMALAATRFAVIAGAADKALSEIAAYTSGGQGTLAPITVEARISALIRRDEAGGDFMGKLNQARVALQTYNDQSSAALENIPNGKFERDMWVRWIGSLPMHYGDPDKAAETRALLDLEPIKIRLQTLGLTGPGASQFGVDISGFFNEGDIRVAFDAAHQQARLMDAVGKQGVVTWECQPMGMVDVGGGSLNAKSLAGDLSRGTRVQVVDVYIPVKSRPSGEGGPVTDYALVQPVEGRPSGEGPG